MIRSRQKAGRHPNTCPVCRSHYRDDELAAALRVCRQCGYHFAVRARERISQLTDAGTFVEVGADLRSADPLAFIDLKPYIERLAAAELATGPRRRDASSARATIGGRSAVLAVMDFSFLGGSMGSVVGEKFAMAADLAVAHGVPFVSVAASGGARMQENILALMQMAKTVMAVDARARRAAAVHLDLRPPDDRRRDRVVRGARRHHDRRARAR